MLYTSAHEISSSYLNFPIFYRFFFQFLTFWIFFFKIYYFFQAKHTSGGLPIKKFIQTWNLGWHGCIGDFRNFSPWTAMKSRHGRATELFFLVQICLSPIKSQMEITKSVLRSQKVKHMLLYTYVYYKNKNTLLENLSLGVRSRTQKKYIH
jgi:hypothetical protein